MPNIPVRTAVSVVKCELLKNGDVRLPSFTQDLGDVVVHHHGRVLHRGVDFDIPEKEHWTERTGFGTHLREAFIVLKKMFRGSRESTE